MADFGHITLVNIYVYCDPIARQGFYLSFYQSSIATLRDILPLQLLSHALKNYLAENLPLRQAIVAQRIQQLISLYRFVTV